MIEIVKEKHTNFAEMHEALRRSINVLERYSSTIQEHEDFGEALSCAIVVRFELAYATCWKFLKWYLKHKHGVELASPKLVFRACSEYGILPENIVDELLTLSDIRNLTANMSDTLAARNSHLIWHDIAKEITAHYKAFGEVDRLIGQIQ